MMTQFCSIDNNIHTCTSNLTLSHLTSDQTGYISCYYDDNVYVPEQAPDSCVNHLRSSVYVFVNDPLSLFVKKRAENDVTVMKVIQSHPLTVPCKASSSTVTVSLFKTNDESDEMEEIKDGTYDPRFGFSICRFKWDPDFGVLVCKGQKEDIRDEYEVRIISSPYTGPLFPVIDDTKASFVHVNGTFSLECSVTIEFENSLTTINWDQDSNGGTRTVIDKIRNSRMTGQSEPGSKLIKISRRLVVEKVQTEDEREYKCTVISASGKFFDASVFVAVHDANIQPGIGTNERYSSNCGPPERCLMSMLLPAVLLLLLTRN